MRRRHAIRELCVEWPAYVPLEGSLWMMPLISSIVATLADASLTSLRYIFTCEVPWMDTLVPMGPAALQELHIQSCHLSVVPPALATLACSLTSLSIGLCEGFAGHVGPPLGLGKALACLTELQHLRLDCATSASGELGLGAASLAWRTRQCHCRPSCCCFLCQQLWQPPTQGWRCLPCSPERHQRTHPPVVPGGDGQRLCHAAALPLHP
jgi:hypothetical protein